MEIMPANYARKNKTKYIYGQIRIKHSNEKASVTGFASDPSQNQNINSRLQFYKTIIEKRKNQESEEESKIRKKYNALHRFQILPPIKSIANVEDEDQEILGL